MSMRSVREAIVNAVKDANSEINGYETVSDVTNVPAVVVGPPDIDFSKAMGRGLDELTFPLFILVGIPEMGIAQDRLDEFIYGSGPLSIRRAIWNDPSLGDVVEDSDITKMRDYGATYSTCKIPHVGATLILRVLVNGTDI